MNKIPSLSKINKRVYIDLSTWFLGNIPRNKGVKGRAPFILDHVKVGVTYTAIKNFERYVLVSGCPAGIPFQHKPRIQNIDPQKPIEKGNNTLITF